MNACVCAVKRESEALSVFEQKRRDVASALGNLCGIDMKDIFLRPLLTHMGILDDYECIGNDGQREIDVVGTDTELGQHYCRGIVEYCGMNNIDFFLEH
eukprot:5119107-Pyramimonas_sp.AAC.1